jgi:hypothetical protein
VRTLRDTPLAIAHCAADMIGVERRTARPRACDPSFNKHAQYPPVPMNTR